MILRISKENDLNDAIIHTIVNVCVIFLLHVRFISPFIFLLVHMARNTKEKAQETRNRILDAAENVFYSKGVSGTSLNDVAQMAEVTRGAIYWHFKNKADLFDAMCERVREPIRAMVNEIADEKTADPLGMLVEGCTHFGQQLIENPHYRKVMTILFHRCEFLDADDPILKNQREWMLHSRESTQSALANAQAKGQLPMDLDLRLASTLLHVAYDGMLNSWLMTPDDFDLVKDGARIINALIDSMRVNRALSKNAA